jgi:alanine dehydrogenase
MKIALIKETKVPADRRTALTPEQLKELSEKYPEHKFCVQRSDSRAFSDREYADLGIPLLDEVDDCDILMGIKEVSPKELIPEKTYVFFSHTAKMQPHNRGLLKEAHRKKITLIDYEYLVRNEQRVVAFGYWAGIVGAYTALLGLGVQTKNYSLKPAYNCHGLEEMKKELSRVKLHNPLKMVITGEGRVASGAAEILEAAGIQKADPEAFLQNTFSGPVYCMIGPQHYTRHGEAKPFSFEEFVRHPEKFEPAFFPFAAAADVFVACHFWDPKSPVFFTAGQMKNSDFRIRCIADISCDIDGPVPTTIRASKLEDPFYGISRENGKEIRPFNDKEITVMAVDNLPGGIPRDASEDFGRRLIQHVIPELLENRSSEMIDHATILREGKLTSRFAYLRDFLRG